MNNYTSMCYITYTCKIFNFSTSLNLSIEFVCGVANKMTIPRTVATKVNPSRLTMLFRMLLL